MSEIKVNKISPRANCGTVTLGDSGDTITIPAGATITNNGTQTGFGRTGAVDWQTGSIKTGTFTAVSGEGYFADTSSGAFTLTLPSSPSAGNIVAVKDYKGTFGNNKLTIDRNGSKINGGNASNPELTSNGQSVTFVYVDGTQGWLAVNDDSTQIAGNNPYVEATGGNSTVTSGDHKIHVFTSPGTFCVTSIGSPSGSTCLEYLVVGGGGGASSQRQGGAGAGGFRLGAICTQPTIPLRAPATTLPATGPYSIAVGAGGTAGGASPTPATCRLGTQGAVSTFHTFTSAGGGTSGFGGSPGPKDGGSGGGGGGDGVQGAPATGGTGNSPAVSPPQGNPGGPGAGYNGGSPGDNGGPAYGGGGGGGASAVGGTAPPGSMPRPSANGGNGMPVAAVFGAAPQPFYTADQPNRGVTVCGTFAGGGGGANSGGPSYGGCGPNGSGGTGGGGLGGNGQNTSYAGTVNSGGGGGGPGFYSPPDNWSAAGTGGSGIVLIKYKFQN